MEQLSDYFPELSADKLAMFSDLANSITDWNSRVNVISRKDIVNIVPHHILHSLAIAKFIRFKPGSRVLDLGTGGGFPGLPLAIYFPEVHFTLIDGTRKKIMVVNEVVKTLGLTNVNALQMRAEEYKEQFDFVVTRAVAPLDQLVRWSDSLILPEGHNALPNGLIALKGGEIRKEIQRLPKGAYTELAEIHEFFPQDYFQNKYVVYVQR